jgi:hypothetical protein
MSHRSVLLLLLAPLALACVARDDDYLVLRRDVARDEGARTTLRFTEPADREALRVRRLLADGFGAELLRTHAMTKRFVARTGGSSAAEAPTVVALGVSDVHTDRCRQVGYRDRVVKASWLAQRIPAEAPIVWADPDPWPALVRGLGGAIVDLIAPGGGTLAPCHALRDGYVEFLKVVAAEWRDASGEDDRAAARASAEFAAVRGNTGSLLAPDRPRDPTPVWAVLRGESPTVRELSRDPIVIATVLYRMAASELGRRMAADDVYRPFFAERPPRGIPPALFLGAFRNFQAKLISAWSRAVRDGRPPANVVDLVEAYAGAYPAERAEAIRIFLVTTYGATALPEPIDRRAPADTVAAQLAALTADVLFGRRGLRDALGSRHGG